MTKKSINNKNLADFNKKLITASQSPALTSLDN